MLKHSQKKAFSLIEVIIAASILSVTVFWVYKLIWENSKLINNSWNYLQLNNLFPALQECIKSRWFSSYTQPVLTTVNFNFWNTLNWCEIGTATEVIIDNIEFTLEWTIQTKTADYIDWELSIEWEWVWKETQNFKLIN